MEQVFLKASNPENVYSVCLQNIEFHTFSATAAAECMTILRFINIHKKPFYNLEPLPTFEYQQV